MENTLLAGFRVANALLQQLDADQANENRNDSPGMRYRLPEFGMLAAGGQPLADGLRMV